MDASAPPRALPRLPGDVVDAVLAFLDVLSLSRACTTSRGRSSSDGLPMAAHGADSWRRVFRARWPPTSLFRLKARVLASAAGCVRRECALRANAARRDVEVVARPYRLRGVAIDDADGNATSVDATVVMGADYTVAGTAALSSGSLRGNAVEAAGVVRTAERLDRTRRGQEALAAVVRRNEPRQRCRVSVHRPDRARRL